MTIRHVAFSFAAMIALIAAPQSAAAGDVLRMWTDLDGDGQSEVVAVTMSPTAKPERARVVVKVGRSEFATEQFGLDGDLPALSTMVVDRRSKQRQLLLQTFEAGSCVFHVLAYRHRKLFPVLSVDTGPDCKPPKASGAGTLSVPNWQGFWWKWTRYRLVGETGEWVAQEDETYVVGVVVTTAKPLTLSGGGCSEQSVAAGSVMELQRYDSRRDSYLARAGKTVCGWLPATTIADPEAVTDVPWAG